MGVLDRLGFARLREGLAKTREGLVGKVLRLVPVGGRIDEELLEKLEEVLIAGDVGVQTSSEIIEAIRAKARQEGSVNDLAGLLKDEIRRHFAGLPRPGAGPAEATGRPRIVMVVGINGVGKTTTIGKLAHLHIREGKRVVIAAADTFRAAANEQLEIWARRAGAEVIRQEHGADPAAVAFDAVRAAAARGADLVIIDTAGRLHTKVNLMEELKKIRRVIGKQFPDAPDEVLLVIDASTGQNGLQQARQFTEAVGVTGIFLTKLDGTARGGIVLAITRELPVPVRYVGVGEAIDDLEEFDEAAFVDALFGAPERAA